MLSNLKH